MSISDGKAWEDEFGWPSTAPAPEQMAREPRPDWKAANEIYTTNWERECAEEDQLGIEDMATIIRKYFATPTQTAAGSAEDREMLEIVAEDGLLTEWNKDYKFSFSQVVRLMAEFAENQLQEHGGRGKC